MTLLHACSVIALITVEGCGERARAYFALWGLGGLGLLLGFHLTS